MEKQIRTNRSEVAKWVGFLVLIISAFVANQMDIQYLKAQNDDRKDEIKEMQKTVQDYGETVANLNGKLDEIQKTVNTIKDAIINSQLNPRRDSSR